MQKNQLFQQAPSLGIIASLSPTKSTPECCYYKMTTIVLTLFFMSKQRVFFGF